MSDYMQGDPDNSVSVPFSDDDEKGATDLDEDSPDASPEERLNRKQRRQARLQAMLADGKKSKAELAELKGATDTLKTELATLRGYIAATQQQQRPANDDGKDPYERRLDAVYDKQSEAYTAAQAEIAAGTFNADRQKHYERVARDIESEKTRIHTERTLASERQSQRADQARLVWEQKYPEVYSNRAAYEYAEGTWKRRKARGEAVTADMVDEIMRETMTEFKLGKRAAPSASDRSRMSGLPAAGGGGGSARPAGALPPELRRMAIAAHSDMSEADAIKKWQATTGKRLREKKVI